MPIRPENVARYPKDWKDVRARILKRAEINGHPHCEECGVPNHDWIERTEAGWKLSVADLGGTYVVLTIAHLDHTPENCADDNLKAWCQRCHNRYDAPVRAAGIADRRRKAKAITDLFNQEGNT